jgi:hypothetical protein
MPRFALGVFKYSEKLESENIFISDRRKYSLMDCWDNCTGCVFCFLAVLHVQQLFMELVHLGQV